VDALLARDTAAALEVIDQAVQEGQELGWLAREVIEALRQLLIVKAAPAGAPPELTPAEVEEARRRGERVNIDELLFLLRAFLEAEGEIRRSPHPRVELEIAAARAARRPELVTVESILERVGAAEARLRRMAFSGGMAKPVAVQESLLEPIAGGGSSVPTSPDAPGASSDRLPQPPPQPEEGLEAGWRRVVEELMQKKPVLGTVLNQSRPLSLKDGELQVSLAGNHFHTELLADRANREMVNQAVRRHVPGALRVEPSRDSAGAGGIEQDPAVQAALEVFEGEVVAVRPRGREGEKP